MEALRRLFERRFGRPPDSVGPIAADGSRRRMVRLCAGAGADLESAIGVLGPEAEENRAFLSYTRTFRSLGLPVPEVLGEDEAARCYLVEDLGDVTLFRALTEARGAAPADATAPFPESMVPVYRRVLDWLPRFQVEGGRAVDYAVAFPREAFDRRSMLWDLNYFKYHFLRLADIPFREGRLEDDFQRLADFLLTADATHFLYRDFQSRNVMLREGAPWFLDYQGGRRGALPYDLASLLYDAKAEIPPPVRDRLVDHYLDALAAHVRVERERFLEHYRGYVLIRIMQAMGAYGYRGFYERKTHFLQSVPPAVRNVEGILRGGPLPVEMPELRAVFERICESERLAELGAPDDGRLTVHVGSFSFRHGVPSDPRGHGGGFVFDCRAVANPGLEPALAALTGRDPEVVRRLEAQPMAEQLFEHALALVRAQAGVFRQRGFTSLSVSFGCTGGQHRSVYFAERLARTLAAEMPDVRVRLEHAERARWPQPVTA